MALEMVRYQLFVIFVAKTKKRLFMPKKEQLDHLQRLVHLISDDNELLSHANDFMQRLVNTKYDALGAQDISAQLAAAEKKKEGRHQ